MICPSCNTENRDDRNQCYHCNTDLTVLRTIILRAKHHYNNGLEHAERSRLDDAIAELKITVSLYNNFPSAHNVLGTLYAKQDKWDQAIEQWQQTLNLDPANKKAADYLHKALLQKEEPVLYRQWRLGKQILIALSILLTILLIWQLRIQFYNNTVTRTDILIRENQYEQAIKSLYSLANNKFSAVHRVVAKLTLDRLDEGFESMNHELLNHIENDEFNEGRDTYQKFLNYQVPPDWKNRLEQTFDQLVDRHIEIARDTAQSILDNADDYIAARSILDELTRLYREDKYQFRIRNAQNEIDRKYYDTSLTLAEEYYENKEYRKSYEILRNLRSRLDLNNLDRGRFDRLENQIGPEMTKQQLATARQYIQRNQFQSFLDIAAEIDVAFLTEQEKNWLTGHIEKARNSM